MLQMTHDVSALKNSSRNLNLSSNWWSNGIICALVVFGSMITSSNSETVVDCSQQALEKCMAPLSFAPGLSMVATSYSADTACKEKIDGVACVESYSNNCLQDDLKKQYIILFILKGRLDFIRDACNGILKEEYTKYQSCATKTTNKVEECASKYGEELGLKRVSSASHDDFTKEEMCCSAVKTMTCVENVAKDECSIDAAKFEHNAMIKYVIEPLTCREYLEKCNAEDVLKDLGNTLKDTANTLKDSANTLKDSANTLRDSAVMQKNTGDAQSSSAVMSKNSWTIVSAVMVAFLLMPTAL